MLETLIGLLALSLLAALTGLLVSIINNTLDATHSWFDKNELARRVFVAIQICLLIGFFVLSGYCAGQLFLG